MSADLTPTGGDLAAGTVDDVVAEMVRVMLERHPALREISPRDLAAALAELLPVYGAMVQARTFGHDYKRREQRADSLTTRVYAISRLQRLAADAEQAANAGIDPAANRTMARMLRDSARREGNR
jgi:hypothetical protein